MKINEETTEESLKRAAALLKQLGMPGDDPEKFLRDSGLDREMDICNKAMTLLPPGIHTMMLMMLVSIFMKGQQSASSEIEKLMNNKDEQGGLLVGLGTSVMDPSQKLVMVGFTMNMVPKLLYGDPQSNFMQQGLAAGDHPLHVMMVAGRTLEELKKKLDGAMNVSNFIKGSETVN